MKWFFTSIVFCLLLKPGVGNGQGIIINEKYRSPSIKKFFENFEPSNEFRYKDSLSIFKQNRIKKVTVIYAKPKRLEGRILYSIQFDIFGKVLSEYFMANNTLYSVRFDTITFPKKKIFIKQIFRLQNERYFAYDSLKKLFQIDSLIEDVCDYKNGDTVMHFLTTTFKSYKTGNLINSRNYHYNYYYLQEEKTNTAGFEYLYFQNNLPFDITKQIKSSFYEQYKSDSMYLTKAFQNTSEFTCSIYPPEKALKNYAFGKHHFVKKHYKKPKTHYYVQGENFVEPERLSSTCGFIHSEKFSKRVITKNENGLNDTVFIDSYPLENGGFCIKPKDANCDFYLKGRSGVPERFPLYAFRYEYFDE